MYSMKQVCLETGLTYETLKFYCNQGLVPNVKRNKNYHRIFDEADLTWIKSLTCLKKCGMSIESMKKYLDLCLQGHVSIPERKKLLAQQKALTLKRIQELTNSVDFIDWKQQYYDDVIAGKIAYTDVSNMA